MIVEAFQTHTVVLGRNIMGWPTPGRPRTGKQTRVKTMTTIWN
jgi:hypothetical protein